MKRSDVIGLLLFGVVVASLFDACRAAVGLEFWHLFTASQDEISVFGETLVSDLMVFGALFILGPVLVGLLIGEFLNQHDDVSSQQTDRERQLQRSRQRRAECLRSDNRGE